jgi:sulfur relay (sulfurtransferase) DsrC/TusE family protein
MCPKDYVAFVLNEKIDLSQHRKKIVNFMVKYKIELKQCEDSRSQETPTQQEECDSTPFKHNDSQWPMSRIFRLLSKREVAITSENIRVLSGLSEAFTSHEKAATFLQNSLNFISECPNTMAYYCLKLWFDCYFSLFSAVKQS